MLPESITTTSPSSLHDLMQRPIFNSSFWVIITTEIGALVDKVSTLYLMTPIKDSMFSDLLRILLAPSVYNASRESELLMQYFSEVDTGVFVDIGANVPESAVSLPFLRVGWTGLAVDPIPDNAESLREAGYQVWCGAVTSEERAKKGSMKFFVAGGSTGRKSSLDQDKIDPALRSSEIEVPLITLETLIKHFRLDHIDFLSVDVEGCESDVLSTVDQLNFSGLLLVEDWARDTSLHNLIISKGYKRVRRTGYNSWYIPEHREFLVSLWGKLHLFLKLNLFSIVRRARFERKRRLGA